MQTTPYSGGSRDSSPSLDTVAEQLEEIHPPTMFYVATSLGEEADLDGENVLVSAGTAWRNPGKSGAGEGFDIFLPETNCLFVDSGGYQAAVHFGDEYPYSPTQLFEWAESIGASYVAGMDWACERGDVLRESKTAKVTVDAIASVPERIERSIEDQIEQAAVYEEGDWSFELVPTVQGYTISDYRYCARRLRQANVARPYMSIGSVCKRDSADKIYSVLKSCKEELPDTEFHLFGATRKVWKSKKFWGGFVSADTHAWAASHPDGGWPYTKQEKQEALDHFRNDIEGVQARIESTTPLHQQSDPLATILGETRIEECACGTTIPAYGTNFEPECRHCEQLLLNRWSRNLHAVETAEKPTTKEEKATTTQQQLNETVPNTS